MSSLRNQGYQSISTTATASPNAMETEGLLSGTTGTAARLSEDQLFSDVFVREQRRSRMVNLGVIAMLSMAVMGAVVHSNSTTTATSNQQHPSKLHVFRSKASSNLLVRGEEDIVQVPLIEIEENDDEEEEEEEKTKTSKADKKEKKKDKKKKDKKKKKKDADQIDLIPLPIVEKRCDWVVDLFTEKYQGRDDDELKEQYAIQSEDPNVFYRATADIFWKDFVQHGWGEQLQFANIGINPVHADGTPLQPKSTWTWTTGDQHLSNFGAWRNRHKTVVFSVNDFDEAAIYDFQVDILRIAVSICSHAITNGISETIDIEHILRAFTDTYVETLKNYVGGDKELLYEITPETADGSLKKYLSKLEDGKSTEGQLEKFTEVDEETGERRFLHTSKTRLIPVDDEERLQKIKDQFKIDNYGATMMKMGWHVRDWDDDYFTVLDVAARLGSGVGSYGVDRYYVLLKGVDDTLDEGDGNAVILDVKYEPPGAVTRVLSEPDAAWYGKLFLHDAHRAIEAQRRLTSYVDPFTGWVIIDDQPFVVRQRSPWKGSPNLDDMTDIDDFIDFVEQIAIATATSHARGTVSKSPGQFKHVISGALEHWADRRLWGKKVAEVAMLYRQQVLLDFQCFQEHVQANYS